ncbi:hypothetical protein Hanom_Chr01g00045471 [Helianthus anomalus]
MQSAGCTTSPSGLPQKSKDSVTSCYPQINTRFKRIIKFLTCFKKHEHEAAFRPRR